MGEGKGGVHAEGGGSEAGPREIDSSAAASGGGAGGAPDQTQPIKKQQPHPGSPVQRPGSKVEPSLSRSSSRLVSLETEEMPIMLLISVFLKMR